VLVTLAALTRTTGLAARLLGTRPFLPALFVLRYSNMGGLDPDVVARHLRTCRSFTDAGWCRYWDAVADEHLAGARAALRRVDPAAEGLVDAALAAGAVDVGPDLEAAFADAALLLAEHGPQRTAEARRRLVAGRPGADPRTGAALEALDHLVKAVTFLQVSAFPGHTPARDRAYWRSRRLFAAVTRLVAPHLGVQVRELGIPFEGDVVHGYLVVPEGATAVPTVVVTNGLEGTVPELLVPLLRYRDSGLATFVMEMPGSYAYQQPMTARSEDVYHRVLDHLADLPEVDANRLAVVGVSFGGYWATRLAATDTRIRCAVACGAPTHRAFLPLGSVGMPQVILQALKDTTGTRTLAGLGHTMRGLSLRQHYARISAPLLVVNGDHDTLLGTQDSIDLAREAQDATLVLYPDDDHCAMRHYTDWLDLSQTWLAEHLLDARV
jgi:esterase FrsA